MCAFHRAKLVRQHQQVEPARCALTAIHFPEQRSLTADDTTAEPLPAPLQKLAATARALEARSSHRATDGDGAHRPAATTPFESLHDRAHSLQSHESYAQQSSKAGNTAGQSSAEEKSADGTNVWYHAAGHDPIWVLLYVVKVRLAQAQLAGNDWQLDLSTDAALASESQNHMCPS